jgi:hypothetical protein
VAWKVTHWFWNRLLLGGDGQGERLRLEEDRNVKNICGSISLTIVLTSTISRSRSPDGNQPQASVSNVVTCSRANGVRRRFSSAAIGHRDALFKRPDPHIGKDLHKRTTECCRNNQPRGYFPNERCASRCCSTASLKHIGSLGLAKLSRATNSLFEYDLMLSSLKAYLVAQIQLLQPEAYHTGYRCCH